LEIQRLKGGVQIESVKFGAKVVKKDVIVEMAWYEFLLTFAATVIGTAFLIDRILAGLFAGFLKLIN